MGRLATLGAMALIALAGCGSPGEQAAEGPGEGEAGFGVPRQNQIDEVTDERSPIVGTVAVALNGCMYLDLPDGSRPWIVWPPETEQGSAGDTVVSAGEEYGDGAAVTGVGAIVALADLPSGDNPDSYFASFGGYCDADTAGVVVLDWLEPAAG